MLRHHARAETDVVHRARDRPLHRRQLRGKAAFAVADGLNAGTRPGVGFTVATPFTKAGNRSEPPMSLPWWSGPKPTAAATQRRRTSRRAWPPDATD